MENKRHQKNWSRHFKLHIVSFFELVYTAACINELLLACEERVAFIADVHLERIHILGGTRLEGFAAGAYNRYFMIFRMYIGLHFIHLALEFNAKILYIIVQRQVNHFSPQSKNSYKILYFGQNFFKILFRRPLLPLRWKNFSVRAAGKNIFCLPPHRTLCRPFRARPHNARTAKNAVFLWKNAPVQSPQATAARKKMLYLVAFK